MSEMNTNPLVSVIVPVYNVAPYLRQCLDSICGQTLKDIEIILVDDGSTDETLSILNEYEQADSRITVLQQKNQYAGVARNNGMKLAKGKYYSFLDADDFFELNMLEDMSNMAEMHQVDMVLCAADIYREAEKRITAAPWLLRTDLLKNADLANFSPAQVLGDRLYEVVKLAPWNKLFRADFVRQNKLEWSPEPRANDVLFVGSALAAAKTMAAVPKPLIHYRVRQDSISHSKSKSTEAHVKAFNALKQALDRLDVNEKVMHSFKLCYMASLVWDCDTLDMEQARIFRQQIIDEIEPQAQLLSPAGYSDACRWPQVEYRYKSIIRPLTTLVCKETKTGKDENWESLLSTIVSIKEADFDILCLSESADSNAGKIFKRYSEKDIRCRHVIDESACMNEATEMQSSSKYMIKMTPELRITADELKNNLQQLEKITQDSCCLSYCQMKRLIGIPPKVSVIVPVYSGKEYFEKMIGSLVNQTLQDIEIIFIDDHGPDGSYSLAEAAAKTDNRIVLLRNDRNMGPGASRNKGIENAKGEFVAFVDADDIIPLDYYEMLYKKAKETGALVVKCGRANLYEDGKVVISTHNRDIAEKLKKGEHLVNAFGWEHTTAIYDRAHVMRNEARNSDALQDEDTGFIMKTLHNLSPEQFAMVDGIMYYYRMHSASVTHTHNASYLSESIKSMKDKLDYISSRSVDKALNTYAAVLVEGRINWRFKKVIHSTQITYQNRYDYLTEICRIINDYESKGKCIPLYGISKRLIKGQLGIEEYISSLLAPEVPDAPSPTLPPVPSPAAVTISPCSDVKLMQKLALLAWGPQLRSRYKRCHFLSIFAIGKKRQKYKQKKANCKIKYKEYKLLLHELRPFIFEK